jgi:uncharacterized membrane protein YgcG
MLFRSFFCPFLILITFCLWGNALSAPQPLHDENRILSASQRHYLEKLGQELNQKTGFNLAVVLLDDSRNKREFLPDDNELMLYTAFKQQQHFVKLGKNLEPALSKTVIEELQQRFLFPEYKSARYDKGTLLLAYHLVKKLVESKGLALSIEPPESGPDDSLNAAGWVFIAIVFSLLFLALYKRGRRTRTVTADKRFRLGRFGRRY